MITQENLFKIYFSSKNRLKQSNKINKLKVTKVNHSKRYKNIFFIDLQESSLLRALLSLERKGFGGNQHLQLKLAKPSWNIGVFSTIGIAAIASMISSCLDLDGSCSCPVELSSRYCSLNILKLSQQFSHQSSQSNMLRLTRLCFCTFMASSTHLLSSFSFSTFSFRNSLIFRSILVFRQLQSTLKGSSFPTVAPSLTQAPTIVTTIKNDYRL